MSEFDIDTLACRGVAPEIIRPMRQRVLRPHQTIDEMVYDGDTSSDTFHLAAMDPTGQVLGIASYYHDPHPLTPSPSDWRLRGMAVEPALQGKGLGSILIQAGIKHIREQGGQRLWCNARVSAQGFYEKLGFTAEGDVFENVPIGPHYVMSIAVG